MPTFPWRCEKGQFHLVATRWMPRAFHFGVEPTSHVHFVPQCSLIPCCNGSTVGLGTLCLFSSKPTSQCLETTRRVGLLWKRGKPIRQLLSCGRFPTLLHQFRSGAAPLILTAHRLSK